ncbi:MAG: TetR/AcrR family transcriptional regulator [Methanobrevibacter wolinii]|nr:TetR/AcrR family transcriptional regulator [Methanobrevibacter wolinii]
MKSKDKILNSLVKLMKHKVYEIITIKEIADNAGVNRSTFYRNFKIKEDIIKYGLEKIMDEFILEFKLIQDKTHQNYIYTILKTYYNHKDFILTVYEAKQLYLFQEVYIKYFKDYLNKINKKEDLYRLYYHIGGIYYFTLCWVSNGMDGNIKELSKIGSEITKDFGPILFDIK